MGDGSWREEVVAMRECRPVDPVWWFREGNGDYGAAYQVWMEDGQAVQYDVAAAAIAGDPGSIGWACVDPAWLRS
ncbi:MAG: hypothetical protein K6U14_12015 [Firmicutes bacterium]|nr:hypothetical protein [Alicyclobacillaceae bacterium]MCL6498338.1 hypothetical protein [Bacillota bacterium]